jgi:hypothetical protein
VEGSGIFEKRSFVTSRARGRGSTGDDDDASAANAPIGDPIDREAGGGSSLLPWLLAGVGLLLVLVAWRLVAISRAGRR